MPEEMIGLSILIVSVKGAELLSRCLDSIYKYAPGVSMRVAVLDNTPLGLAGGILSGDPARRIDIIRQEGIYGFASNQNRLLAMLAPQSRYCLMLNDDAEVCPGALDTMIGFMEAHPDAASIGAQLVAPDGKFQFSGGAFPSLTKEIIRYSGLARVALTPQAKVFIGRYFGRLLPREARLYLKSFYCREPAVEVDFVSGCAMMLRREAIKDVGLLDERYFMYAEDVDWCRRAKAKGWNIYLLKKAKVIHYLRQSSTPRAALEYERSMLNYFLKYKNTKLFMGSYWLVIAAISFLKYIYHLLTGAPDLAAAYLDICRIMSRGLSG